MRTPALLARSDAARLASSEELAATKSSQCAASAASSVGMCAPFPRTKPTSSRSSMSLRFPGRPRVRGGPATGCNFTTGVCTSRLLDFRSTGDPDDWSPAVARALTRLADGYRTKPEQIKPGDIVSFSYGQDTIIHRVLTTNYDDKGWYMITKGDNNNKPDPKKIRFDQVRRLVVAIIY